MRGLDKLHPVVQAKALKLQKLAKERLGLSIIFLDTLRSEAEQQAYYAQGRESTASVNAKRKAAGLYLITDKENKIITKAKSASFSWHGFGLAFDIAITDANGKKIIWDKTSDWNGDGKDDWAQVGALADECGLEWGGNFSSIYDAPHYQDRMGMSLAYAQSKFKPGMTVNV
jgi:peptidoglycan L-alanyl-D-glutamate endopeptidase CwlK